MSIAIAVDVGFGYTKAMNEKGEKVKFPSVVAGRGGGGIDIVGGKQDDYSVTFYKGGAESSYLVGDAALGCGGTRTWEEKVETNKNLDILIATSCALLGNGSPISLSVGLPLAYYRNQKDKLRAVLDELDREVEVNGSKRRVMVKDVSVYPQGAGAYYSEALSINGDIKDWDMLEKSCGVIDIGYRTTDYLAMTRGKKGLIPREDMMGGMDYGMNFAVKMVKSMVDEAIGANIPVQWIEQAIVWEEGMLEYKGKTYNLKPFEGQVYARLAEQIAAGVKQKWGQELDRLSMVLIAGGGGIALYPYLKTVIETTKLVNDPYFANAQGFLAVQGLKTRRG